MLIFRYKIKVYICFKKTYESAGFRKGICRLFGFYLTRADLRHSHASLLISKLGAQPLMVAERLGHEKIQTTLNTYSHLYPNQARDLADRLNGLNGDDSEEEDTEDVRET